MHFFLVYLQYMQPFYRTSTFDQNHAYCIRIFTANKLQEKTQLTFVRGKISGSACTRAVISHRMIP